MAIYLFVLLAAIGLGPMLAVRRARWDDAACWLLAPAVGFEVVAVACTLLVDCGWPIARWGVALAVLLVACSGGLAYLNARRRRTAGARPDPSVDADDAARRAERRWGLSAVVVGCVLAFLPVLIGGRWYFHARGNAWDANMYVTAARSLMAERFGRLDNPDPAALAAANDAYVETYDYLHTGRWTSFAALGWCTVVTGSRPYPVEPHYCALQLMLAIGPAFVLARRLRAGVRWAFVASVLVGTGFWAQFAFDLQSLSQLECLVVMLLMLAVWPGPADVPGWNPVRGDRALVLLASCAWPLLYPEQMPLMVLGVLLGLGLTWWRGRPRAAAAATAAQLVPVVAGMAGAALLAPVFRYWAYSARLVTLSHERDGWINSQHMWLANNPLVGFWGLTHLDAGAAGWWSAPLGFATTLLACSLTALSLSLFLGVVFGRDARAADWMLAGMLLSGLGQSFGMLCLGQSWAAAKGVGYAAPLCLLGVVGWWAAGAARGAWPKPPARWVASAAVLSFCLAQSWSAVLRVVLVASRSDYLRYINHVPFYRMTDFDIDPIRAALAGRPGTTKVGLLMANPWLQHMARVELGFDVRVFEPRGMVDLPTGKVLAAAPPPDGAVDYWLFDAPMLPASASQRQFVARTADLTLVRDLAFIVQILSPNGVERDPATGEPTFWLGDQPAVVQVNAPADGRATLAARFVPGPSQPGSAVRRLALTSEAIPTPQEEVVGDGRARISFPVRAGINNVRVACLDKPSASAPVDLGGRTLLLQVIGPQLEFVPVASASERAARP